MKTRLESRTSGCQFDLAIHTLGLLVGIALLGGCVASQVQVPHSVRSPAKPKPTYCFDTVGHMNGSKPFIVGGTCCCTPTQELMDKYHAEGLLRDMQVKDLLLLYENAGIKTALDHHGCNNLCKWGPHVIKGGKCMVPPTPGTYNFEEVRFGIRYVPSTKTGAKQTTGGSQ